MWYNQFFHRYPFPSLSFIINTYKMIPFCSKCLVLNFNIPLIFPIFETNLNNSLIQFYILNHSKINLLIRSRQVGPRRRVVEAIMIDPAYSWFFSMIVDDGQNPSISEDTVFIDDRVYYF